MVSLDTPICMLTLGQLWEALTKLNQGQQPKIKPKKVSLATDICNLGLSLRLTNSLISIGCDTLEDVLRKHPNDFKRTRGLGKESFRELSDFLKNNGYQFGEFRHE